MESTDSSGGPQLPPGFRFHPTDEELVVHYLKKKAASAPLPVAIIAEVDLYKFDPWELPAKATFGEQEWYFFSPRDRKYPNGARPNRAATSGYWKATGTDKPVLTGGGTQKVGVKKALVFYGGKPPKGVKTNWIMHEYRLADAKSASKPPGCDLVSNKKASLRLDDWVLCRIYKKNNSIQRPMDHRLAVAGDDMFGSIQTSMLKPPPNYASLMETDHHHHQRSSLYGGVMGSNTAALPLLAAEGSLGKRSVSNLYWNEEENHEESGNSGGSTRRFLTERWDGSSGQETPNSIVTILNQIPQTPSLQEQPMLGTYQVSGINWYS